MKAPVPLDIFLTASDADMDMFDQMLQEYWNMDRYTYVEPAIDHNFVY
jgi:hypothetical protein